jgi:hypothetical protein
LNHEQGKNRNSAPGGGFSVRGTVDDGGCKDLFHPEGPSKPPEFTVSFDAEGGNLETQKKTVVSGDPIGAFNMPSEPTRSEYTFGGWYTGRNGGDYAITLRADKPSDLGRFHTAAKM